MVLVSNVQGLQNKNFSRVNSYDVSIPILVRPGVVYLVNTKGV